MRQKLICIIIAILLSGCSEDTIESIVNTEPVNKNYDNDEAKIKFLKTVTQKWNKDEVLKEMATSGRVRQTYIADMFDQDVKISAKQAGSGFFIESLDKKYLEENEFYKIDLITFSTTSNINNMFKAIKFARDGLFNWKKSVDVYSKESFEATVDIISDNVVPGSFFYTYYANNQLNVNDMSIVKVTKIKEKNKKVGVNPNDGKTPAFYEKSLSKDDIAKLVKKRDPSAVPLTHFSVVVSGEEIEKINDYINKNIKMIKFPLIAKLECMTILEDTPVTMLVTQAEAKNNGASFVVVPKEDKNLLKYLTSGNI